MEVQYGTIFRAEGSTWTILGLKAQSVTIIRL
jgi:hypothetical protein